MRETGKPGSNPWTKKGRRCKFATAQELRDSCQDYLDHCENNPIPGEVIKNSRYGPKRMTVYHPRATTVQGLCNHLGIDLSTWWRYKQRDEYADTCAWAEQVMFDRNMALAAAGELKEHIVQKYLGISDKIEQHVTTSTDDGDDDFDPSRMPSAARNLLYHLLQVAEGREEFDLERARGCLNFLADESSSDH